MVTTRELREDLTTQSSETQNRLDVSSEVIDTLLTIKVVLFEKK